MLQVAGACSMAACARSSAATSTCVAHRALTIPDPGPRGGTSNTFKQFLFSMGERKREQPLNAVSYTHLTLPTICSV
eukprot:7054201-Alexandrium_andersonii.AAC.1